MKTCSTRRHFCTWPKASRHVIVLPVPLLTPCVLCRHAILTDLFRHAFDGGGADNFFDAGSCIDGRLTSAWNWGSKLEKKTYAPIFKLAGFTSFDGEFVK